MEDHPSLAVKADLPSGWQSQSLFAPSVSEDARELRLVPVLSYGMGWSLPQSFSAIWMSQTRVNSISRN